MTRHAPRERVSWNLNLALRNKNAVVTLHVSVWVEMIAAIIASATWLVTLHVSVWVEIDFSDAERQEHGVTLHVSVWVEMPLKSYCHLT